MARSRRSAGRAPSTQSSSRSTWATERTAGSFRPRLGATRVAVGSAGASPSAARNRKKPRSVERARAEERAEKYLRELGIWDKRDTVGRALSGGMKRRLMIARALVHEPRLLILDEPTAGVDIEMRRSMWDFLKRINAEGTTIILTTHYLEEAEALCRHVGIINHGEIVENTSIRELLRQLQREVFILDCVDALPADVAVEGFVTRRMDDTCLEVEVEKGQAINQVFASLDRQGVQIASMRNRANRLEEMFVKLVEGAA